MEADPVALPWCSQAGSSWSKKAKSKALIGSDEDESKPGKKSGPKSFSGFNKPHRLSQALATVVGVDIMRSVPGVFFKQNRPRLTSTVSLSSRPQLTKQLWVYIKAKGLQDPMDGRQIIPDEQLKAAFGPSSFTSFEMAKKLGPCLYPMDADEIEKYKVKYLAEHGDD